MAERNAPPQALGGSAAGTRARRVQVSSTCCAPFSALDRYVATGRGAIHGLPRRDGFARGRSSGPLATRQRAPSWISTTGRFGRARPRAPASTTPWRLSDQPRPRTGRSRLPLFWIRASRPFDQPVGPQNPRFQRMAGGKAASRLQAMAGRPASAAAKLVALRPMRTSTCRRRAISL